MFLFEMVGDQDFSSLYPSIIMALNLAPTTEVGKFIWLDPKIKKNLIEKYGYDGLFATSKNEEASETTGDAGTGDIALSLADSIQSQDWGKIGSKFFLLPSTEELVKRIKSKNY